MSSTDDHEDQVDQGTAVPVTSQPQSRTESPAPKSQPSLPYTISYSATGTPLSVTYQLPSLPTQQQTHPQLQLAPALLPQPSHLAQQLTQAQLAQPPAQIQLAPAIQPQPQAISNAAGTQLAVAYLLPVMPGQQPTHLLGTQPTQPTVKVQGVKFVRPQSQVNPMSVQQPPMQQENVVISDIPQTVPQSPVQCDLNLAYGQALQSGRLANVTSSPEVQQVVTEVSVCVGVGVHVCMPLLCAFVSVIMILHVCVCECMRACMCSLYVCVYRNTSIPLIVK